MTNWYQTPCSILLLFKLLLCTYLLKKFWVEKKQTLIPTADDLGRTSSDFMFNVSQSWHLPDFNKNVDTWTGIISTQMKKGPWTIPLLLRLGLFICRIWVNFFWFQIPLETLIVCPSALDYTYTYLSIIHRYAGEFL